MPPVTIELRVSLKHIDPPIWRRLRVSGDLTLYQLHHTLQIAMGWTDSHLHHFFIADERYALPDPEDDDDDRPTDERKVKLHDVVKLSSRFVYEYDFGDGWEHEIEVEKVDDLEPEAPAVCIAGERACPPEDAGGPWAYTELLEIVRDPGHTEYHERREWLPDGFDPKEFDLALVNQKLGTQASRLSSRGTSRRG